MNITQSHEMRHLTDAEVDAVSGGKKRQDQITTEQSKVGEMLAELKVAQDPS